MSQHEIISLADSLASQYPGAELPAAYTKLRTAIFEVDGEPKNLRVTSRPDVGGIILRSVPGVNTELSATVFRYESDPDMNMAIVTSPPRAGASPDASRGRNDVLFTIGQGLRRQPEEDIRDVGRIAQEFADIPSVPLYGYGEERDLVQAIALPGTPLVGAVDKVVEQLTQNPDETHIDYNTFYGTGRIEEMPFVVKVMRSVVYDKGGEYRELDLHTETPLSCFMLTISGAEHTVQSHVDNRETPVYPQFIDSSIAMTREAELAIDDLQDALPPQHTYPTHLALDTAKDYLVAVRRTAVDRIHLFGG